jgi:hypothetical protein
MIRSLTHLDLTGGSTELHFQRRIKTKALLEIRVGILFVPSH